MKKVLMLIGVAAYAIGVQAASIDWSITSNTWYLPDGTSKAPTGTTVYLIDGDQWTTIKSAIEGGAKSFTTSDAGILDARATTNAKGYIPAGTATHGSLVAGQTYNFAYLVFSDDKYFASATTAMTAYEDGHQTFGEKMSADFASKAYTGTTLSSGWQSAAPIPEPTSGLLLLVGASLLALRRKQK